MELIERIEILLDICQTHLRWHLGESVGKMGVEMVNHILFKYLLPYNIFPKKHNKNWIDMVSPSHFQIFRLVPNCPALFLKALT